MNDADKQKLMDAKSKILEGKNAIDAMRADKPEDGGVANALGEIVDDLENIETAIDEAAELEDDAPGDEE